MAEKYNISKGKTFLSLMESDIDEQFLHEYSAANFVGLGKTGVESGQNFSSVAASGEPNVLLRGQLGFGNQLIPKTKQITSPTDIQSLSKNKGIIDSPTSPISHQSLPWTFESGSSSSSNEFGANSSAEIYNLNATDLLMAVSISTEENMANIAKLALEAMEDLRKTATDPGEPLWRLDRDKNVNFLDVIEYAKNFGNMRITMLEIDRLIRVRPDMSALPRLWPKNYSGYDSCGDDEFFDSLIAEDLLSSDRDRYIEDNLQSVGSREIGYIGMKPLELVELFMNLEKWSKAFSDIVSKTSMIGVLVSPGAPRDYEETLQVLRAEFQFPSPLVPARETTMARYCKRLEWDLWGIVDVSLESLFQLPSSKHFRRRPSGCLIRKMTDGSSKVTWVEHVEADTSNVHEVFEKMVSSGFAFSAKRWLETLARHSQRPSSPKATISLFSNSVPEIGRKNMMKLSERMVRNFFRDMLRRTIGDH